MTSFRWCVVNLIRLVIIGLIIFSLPSHFNCKSSNYNTGSKSILGLNESTKKIKIAADSIVQLTSLIYEHIDTISNSDYPHTRINFINPASKKNFIERYTSSILTFIGLILSLIIVWIKINAESKKTSKSLIQIEKNIVNQFAYEHLNNILISLKENITHLILFINDYTSSPYALRKLSKIEKAKELEGICIQIDLMLNREKKDELVLSECLNKLTSEFLKDDIENIKSAINEIKNLTNTILISYFPNQKININEK